MGVSDADGKRDLHWAPTPPQPHMPSFYMRPTTAPTVARRVRTSDGARIATFVYGRQNDATPVLFLHGNGEEHGIFGPIIDTVVASGRSVVAVDSRGQGASTRGSSRLTYELMADDALAALDALGVSRVHVVGFSDGGIEGILLARDHADRVASLLALGANLSPDGILDDGWNLEGAVSELETWADWLDSDDCDLDGSIMRPTAKEARISADLLRLMIEEPHIPSRSLNSISCPTTIMVGQFDAIDPQETRRIVNAIPRSRLVVVEGADHVLPKCAPERVTDELFALIARAESENK